MKFFAIDLHTADLEATRLFYVRRLGGGMLSRSDSHPTVYFYDSTGNLLEIIARTRVRFSQDSAGPEQELLTCTVNQLPIGHDRPGLTSGATLKPTN